MSGCQETWFILFSLTLEFDLTGTNVSSPIWHSSAAVLWSSGVGGGHAIVPNLGAMCFIIFFLPISSLIIKIRAQVDLQKLK